MGSKKFGVDPDSCQQIATSVQQIVQMGVQVAIVIGGGNIFRGANGSMQGIARTPADQIGMLATMMNGIFLQQSFENIGCESRVISSIACDVMVESYNWKNAHEYLNKGIVLIFVAGTGNPYFTTDSAAALRALEMQADVLIKATKVDGIYDKDPLKNPDAVKFDKISYTEILTKQLQVMDATAIALCRENQIPIRICNMFENETLRKAVCNQPVGTLVEGK